VQVWAEPPMDQIPVGANIPHLSKLALRHTQPPT